MEINQLFTTPAHEKGAEINIVHPVTGEKTDVFITVQGVDSKAWRTSMRQRVQDRIAAQADGKEAASQDNDAELLADITLDWRGLTADGMIMPFSREAALNLYSNSPGIMRQVDQFISNRKNFING